MAAPERACQFCGEQMPANSIPYHIREECPATHREDHAPEFITDGGQQQIGVGTVVRDRESKPGSDAVVVQLPDAPASDRWIPQLEETVADANPDYPPDAAVAVIVFRDRLEDTLGEWRELTADGLQTAVENADLPTYDYPVGRLEVVP